MKPIALSFAVAGLALIAGAGVISGSCDRSPTWRSRTRRARSTSPSTSGCGSEPSRAWRACSARSTGATRLG